MYDAKVESQAQLATAIAALSNGSSIAEIQKAIANKARKEEWPTLGVEALFDSVEIPNKAKAKYLEFDNANAKKFSVMLSALGTDTEKKKEKVTAFANATKTLDNLLKEARQAAEQTTRTSEWDTFGFQNRRSR